MSPSSDTRRARSNAHAASPWVLAVETARRAITDAGLRVDQIDGFVRATLFPTAGAHRVEDGVSIVSPNWLAQQPGVDPSYAAGFTGIGQIPGSVALAVNAVASGAAELRRAAPGAPQSRWPLPRQPHAEAGGAQQWTAPQGYFGPLAMIALPYNEYLQRYGARREDRWRPSSSRRGRTGRGSRGRSGTTSRSRTAEYLAAPMLFDPVCRFDCDIPVDGVAMFVFTTAERARDLPHPPGVRRRLWHEWRVRPRAAPALAA